MRLWKALRVAQLVGTAGPDSAEVTYTSVSRVEFIQGTITEQHMCPGHWAEQKTEASWGTLQAHTACSGTQRHETSLRCGT